MMTDTWYILLSGLVQRQEWEVADMVVEDLKKSGMNMAASLGNLVARVSERRAYEGEARSRRTRTVR